MGGDETGIVPADGMLPIPRASIEDMKAVASFIDNMKKALMVEDVDYVRDGRKQYTTRSGFAKLALGFGLSDEIIEEHELLDKDDEFLGWRVKVRVWQPGSGRQSNGVGACTVLEDNIQRKEKRTPGRAVHHDTYATAHTRALNRAISNIVGSAEVSAEEMRAGTTYRESDQRNSLVLPEGFKIPDWDFVDALKGEGWGNIINIALNWIGDSGLDPGAWTIETEELRALAKCGVFLGDSFGEVSRMLHAAGFTWRQEKKAWVLLKPEGVE